MAGSALETYNCRCDEIGRRSGLKIHRWQHRAGSSPATGTTSPQASYRLRRLFIPRIKSHLALMPLRLLSAKGHARRACSLVNALTTARCRYQPFAGSRVCRYHYFYHSTWMRSSMGTLFYYKLSNDIV